MVKGRKLKKVLGIDNGDGEAPMKKILPSDSRVGAWKVELLPAPRESEVNKGRHVPVSVDDQIVEDVANGKYAAEIERAYGLRDGYVRSCLVRRFGSIEGMKRALQAQCLENAIALNDYAISRIESIAPGQALVGAKIMIEGALALEKSRVDRPSTVDFAGLAALGSTLERIEKVITGSDRTVALGA